MGNLRPSSWFNDTDQYAFDLFAAEIRARKPQYIIEKTPDKCRHDAVINGNIAVEIKTRWKDKSGRDVTRDSILKSPYGPNVMMNHDKLEYLRNLSKGSEFKQVFLAYFLKDGFFLLDVSKLKIVRSGPMSVNNHGKGFRVEPMEHIDISNEIWYPRITS